MAPAFILSEIQSRLRQSNPVSDSDVSSIDKIAESVKQT